MPNADKRATFTPAPFAVYGWADSDPYTGQAGYEEGFGPAVMPNFTRPIGPSGEATLHAAAGMEHVNRADYDQATGVKMDRVEQEYRAPMITPTSVLFNSNPPTQPSDWHSGVRLPDWMEA